ncbi:MAG: alanine--tRNA ligase [Candidatus Cloacimonetes bacterium]|nr:alanine--tRNA ligase [Candidatus Cloacimonadota bacterium]
MSSTIYNPDKLSSGENSAQSIRRQFIDFFLTRGHSSVPSAPVIPPDDPTLLFTNAGMNQFKNIFLGKTNPTVTRAVNSQKCIRAGGKHNDLEEVGKDGYHHTFFEMLGNWSFADYYKREAIIWAWELLTEVWQLPRELLHATVHHSDEEAYQMWLGETDIGLDQVSYHGDKDNFWEMGESGPCGPCSEIHYDRGLSFCDKQDDPDHRCAVNGDCGRFIELWNLVFIQYFRDEKGELHPLQHRYIDTGAGFERICQVLQDKRSNYETDLFTPILAHLSELSGVAYGDDSVSHCVIADHIRMLTFALADGGFPSNEGRGYVIRRILRRACRHGRLLGFRSPFLFKLVPTVTALMGGHFTELKGREEYIQNIIRAEEERFNQTLDTGLEKFTEIVSSLTDKTIPGKDVFTLYDTYGFPPDLTGVLAEEKGLHLDLTGFQVEMEKQRQRARDASKFALPEEAGEWIEFAKPSPTFFRGYETLQCQAHIVRYRIGAEGAIQLQLDQTPFYAESGGQIGDTGSIGNEGFEMIVTDVKKVDDHYIHLGRVIRGLPGQEMVIAHVDGIQRKATARHHTATHLLHKALKSVLGEHVQQKGSLVSPEHLRFDFVHHQGLTASELRSIEHIANQIIRENRAVHTEVMNLNAARESGAVALFGEKYAEVVRVVNVIDFSRELCGGTHIAHTGEIGLVKIIAESSIAAGIRRIEAVCGSAAENWINERLDGLHQIYERLGANEKNVFDRIDQMKDQIRDLAQKLEQHRQQMAESRALELIQGAEKLNGTAVIIQRVEVADIESLRLIGDALKARSRGTIAMLFALAGGKVNILVTVSADLVNRYHAGKIIGKIAELVDGKGGGRPDLAMAGGKDPAKLENALIQSRQVIRDLLA